MPIIAALITGGSKPTLIVKMIIKQTVIPTAIFYERSQK